MRKIDAVWELENIGSRVLEIVVDTEDVFQESDFNNISPDYDYIVVKVPTNKTDFNWFLGENGYTMIESQLKMSINIRDIDYDNCYVRRIMPFVRFDKVESENCLKEILDRISPTMFITDRISLDPYYGPEVGCKRYQTYIRNSFLNKRLELFSIGFKEQVVGFTMLNINDDVCLGELGGIFSDVSIPGLGCLTVLAPLLYYSRISKNVNAIFSANISSNNIPVIKVYNYLNFHIENMKYVFVKHFKE